MRTDIVRFLKKECPRRGLSAVYNKQKDMYVVHKKGYGVQNFTSTQFYEIPKSERARMFIALTQRGLTHNLGESSLKGTLNVHIKHGTKIV